MRRHSDRGSQFPEHAEFARGNPTSSVQPHRNLIIALATQHRLPAIYGNRLNVQAGGLISYGANAAELYRRGADFVDKILRGAKPADIPVEQPTKFELIINLTAAKALGLTLTESFLLRADEVIE